VGPVAARELARAFATYGALAQAPLEQLERIDGWAGHRGVGPPVLSRG